MISCCDSITLLYHSQRKPICYNDHSYGLSWLVSLTRIFLTPFTQVHSPTTSLDADIENQGPSYSQDSKNTLVSVIATPLRQPQPRSTLSISGSGGPLRSSSSQSTNCLTTGLVNGYTSSGQHQQQQFLNNLVRMNQTKIWEDAKCRTFYARDNVCNFIRWSKEFGVNQSVLFESDDLVLHGK